MRTAKGPGGQGRLFRAGLRGDESMEVVVWQNLEAEARPGKQVASLN